MKKQMDIIKLAFIAIVAILLINISCSNSKKLPDGVHEVVVKEVIQTGSYTYLNVTDKGADQWLAVSAMEAKAGETYFYKGGVKMTDFPSKELNRTFKEIFFIDDISKTVDFPKNINGSGNPHNPMGNTTDMDVNNPMTKKPIEKVQVKVEPLKGGITVAELFSKKADYAGKTIKIKGQVTKFNPEIMGKNWIHIQDGTEAGGEFDLTATSAIQVNVGDVITLEGKIALDKDFGYGYVYKVILEDAVLVK